MTTTEAGRDLADLNDPGAFVPGVPHETFAHWRRTDPVHFIERDDGPGYWSITTYDDVVAVSGDAATFSSERGGVFMFELEEEVLAQQKPDAARAYANTVDPALERAFMEELAPQLGLKVEDLL